nr:carboxypeptidase regulatory-like domain-containing protein [Acidobacteriota bacterium]
MPHAYRKSCLRMCLVLFAVLALAGAATAEERAGTLTGRVTDPNGNPLPGARVHLEPRALEVTTGADGRFAVSGLPAGRGTAEVSCIGFVTEKRDLDLAAGRDTRLDLQLTLDLQVSETVTVTTSRARGEVEALNQEKNATNVVNVLPADVVTSLPNVNVADAVGRLPSVSLERDEGEGKYIQIRGTDPHFSNFEIDGVHIPSPESFVRNVKLDVIPADLIGSIELHKTLAADQDGDAIGGSINLVTKSPGDQPNWAVGGQAGNTQILRNRQFYQGSASYGIRFGEDRRAGLFVGADYDWNGRGINDIEPSVDSVDLGQGPVPVFTGIDFREYRYDRSRIGGSGALDYRLGPAASLYARGLLADFKNYGDRWVLTDKKTTPNDSPDARHKERIE